jgi:hypothetical protein
VGVPNVKRIGAPFSYLVKMLAGADGVPSGVGTICFPVHTAEGLRPTYSAEALVDYVIIRFPGPFTVSVFYQDLESDYVRVYRDAGWRLVSFGDRSTSTFLFRQYSELVGHSHVVSNMVQSATWYGAILGRQCSVVPPRNAAAASLLGETDPYNVEARWPSLYSEGDNLETVRDYGRAELGWDRVLEPEELANMLAWRGGYWTLLASSIGWFNDRRFGAIPQ